MHTISSDRIVRSLRGVAVVSLAPLAACATPATRRADVVEPSPCVDSTYVQLKRTHPDSLSDRAWQRLQSLEHACVASRGQSPEKTSRMMGTGHLGAHWIAIGIGTAMMVAMLIAMW